ACPTSPSQLARRPLLTPFPYTTLFRSDSVPGASLPDTARVVIVGGGIAGASVAHHLAEQGWDGIVLLDKGPLWQTGGSTSHAPGLVFQHNASRTMTRLAQWTVELLSRFDCYQAVGGIEVATTEERWAELDRRWARSRGYGLDASLLSPAEVADRVPLIDPELILGGFGVADDGVANALRAAEALTRGPIDSGALTAFGSSGVTGVRVSEGAVEGVETPRGFVRADHVVIACGIWGPLLERFVPRLHVP